MVNTETLIFTNAKQCETIRSFAENILNDKITLNDADKDQSVSLVEVMDFKIKNKTAKSRKKAAKVKYFQKLIWTF